MADNPSTHQSNFRILIADDDQTVSRRLYEYLQERGFATSQVMTGRTAKERIREWRPHFIILDLTLPEINGFDILRWLKQGEIADYRPKVIITSSHNIVKNIKECISLGASDYVIKPYKFEDMMARLVFHIQNKREIGKGANVQFEGTDVYLNLLDVVLRETLSGRKRDEVLHNLSKMIAITLKAVRCSIVMVSEDLQAGTVIASSDDKPGARFNLDLNKYPEMLHVMTTEKAVVIEDLAYDPMLAKIKDLVKGISFNSMIISPVRRNNEMFGVISARMDKEHSKFNDRDIRFIQLIAQTVSLYLCSTLVLPHELLKVSEPKKESA